MALTRPFVAVRTSDQWLRCAHRSTSLDEARGVVALGFTVEAPVGAEGALPTPAGLAFDSACRLFHSLPEEGRVERLLWGAYDPLHPRPGTSETADVFATESPEAGEAGEFGPAEPQAPQALLLPRGLAVDDSDRLYVAESGAARVLVLDLPTRRVLRRIPLAGAPFGLAAHGARVYAAVPQPAALVRLRVHDEPEMLPLPAGVVAPSRVACDAAGRLALLDRAGQADATVFVIEPDGRAHAFAPADDVAGFRAGDVAFGADGLLVVAGAPGADFLRFRVAPDGARSLQPPLRAARYDGRGIAVAPEARQAGDDSRIVYWSALGARHAFPAPLRYARRGRVTSFRLDSGAYRTQWGRVFIDACIPPGTSLRLHAVASDEPPEGLLLAPGLPDNVTPPPGEDAVPFAELTPPLPPLVLALAEDAAAPQALHARETGRELLFARASEGDPFETWEAPLLQAPLLAQPALGRYLWLTLELQGDTRATPRVRALRAEHPGHDLVQRLPRVFSQEPEAASFLQRYLTPLEGALLDLEARAAQRHVLLDPRATPEELLPWLASFVGLALDGRLTPDARRTLVAEAVTLFRFRGTLFGLRRLLEIALGVRVLIVEHWRLRGLGATRLGSGSEPAAPVVGAGFRVGGALADPADSPRAQAADDAFRTHAHRFSVIVPAPLSAEREALARDLLDAHRPAHTLYELCTVEGGMRVGLGLLLELTSVVGPSAGFRPLLLGAAVLGREALLGGGAPAFSRVGGTLSASAGEWGEARA